MTETKADTQSLIKAPNRAVAKTRSSFAARGLSLLKECGLSLPKEYSKEEIAKMMISGIRADITSFDGLVADIAKTIGNAGINQIRPFLEKGWDRLSSREPETYKPADYDETFSKYEEAKPTAETTPECLGSAGIGISRLSNK